MSVGPNSSNLVPINAAEFTQGSLTLVNGLYSGDVEKLLLSEWNSKGRVFLRQSEPKPMTLLAVIPDFDIGD